MQQKNKPIIHRYQATAMGLFVNVFLIETERSIIAVDAALAVSSSREIRDIIEHQIRKPLVALLLTHGHPDHYTGIAEITKNWQVQVVSTQHALEQMKKRDESEGPVMAAIFKNEYPNVRAFPNRVVESGETLVFDSIEFTIEDFGPCESDNDSIWTLKFDGIEHVFSGDLIYNKMHVFIRDMHINEWLGKLDILLTRYDHTTVFHNGHGEDCGIEMLFWQKAYLQAVVALLKSFLKGKDQLSDQDTEQFVSKMKSFLPNDTLLPFLTFELEKTVSLMKERGLI